MGNGQRYVKILNNKEEKKITGLFMPPLLPETAEKIRKIVQNYSAKCDFATNLKAFVIECHKLEDFDSLVKEIEDLKISKL